MYLCFFVSLNSVQLNLSQVSPISRADEVKTSFYFIYIWKKLAFTLAVIHSGDGRKEWKVQTEMVTAAEVMIMHQVNESGKCRDSCVQGWFVRLLNLSIHCDYISKLSLSLYKYRWNVWTANSIPWQCGNQCLKRCLSFFKHKRTWIHSSSSNYKSHYINIWA